MANMFTKGSFNPYLAAAGGLGVGGGLGSLFGYDDPADAADPYMSQIAPTLEKYLSPYAQAGAGALNPLMGQYSGLMSDPTALMNKIGASYQASPEEKFDVGQATSAANQAAAAGGMAGSPAEQQELAKTVTGLSDEDYNRYLSNALGMYSKGLGGMQQMAGMGESASSDLATSLANALASRAKLAYAGQEGQNEAFGGGLGSLIGGAASLASMF